MKIFYDSLPFPIFLSVTFIVPLLVFIHFLKRKDNYPFVALIGIAFLCLSGFSAGAVRIFSDYNLLEEYSDWYGALPIPFVLLTIPFILVGAYQKVKNDKKKRIQILFVSIGLFVIILYIALLGIFK